MPISATLATIDTQAEWQAGTIPPQVNSTTVPGSVTLYRPTLTFARASIAYDTTTGAQVAAGVARYVPGRLVGTYPADQALFIEEGATNLYSASQSQGQTWSTNASSVVTLTPGQADPLGGTNAVRVQTSGGTTILKAVAGVTVVPNTVKWSGQIWIRNRVATLVTVHSNQGGMSAVVDQSEGWKQVPWTITGNGVGVAQHQLRVPTAADSVDCDVAFLQYEAQPYITSWVLGGTTRATESALTPSTGLSEFGPWTIKCWAKMGHALVTHRMPFASWTKFYADLNPSDRPQLSWVDAANVQQSGVATAVLSNPTAWHSWALTFDGSTAILYADGIPVVTAATTFPKPFAATGVSWGNMSPVSPYQIDGPVDDMAVLTIVQTPAEILAWSNATAPLVADANTLALVHADGTLISDYPPYATITTRTFDLGSPRVNVTPAITAALPSGTAAVVTRWRDAAADPALGGVFGAWQTATGGAPGPVIQRWLQLEMTLATTDTALTPTVDKLILVCQDVVLFISGVERTGMMKPATLQIPDRLSERSEASCTLVSRTGGYYPQPLDGTALFNRGALVFEGFLWDPELERMVEDATRNEMFIYLKAVDNHLLADRRIVAETYDNQTAGYIVKDLIAKYLAADGVIQGTIQDGPVIVRSVFNYQPLSKCLDELADLAGFIWNLGPGRATTGAPLDFMDRATNVAPWSVTNTAKVSRVRVRKHPELYRNRELFRAGQGVTDPRTDHFIGDGKLKSFPCNFPLAMVPTITINGGPPVTIGIRGVDTGKAWYWNKGDNQITQDDGTTPLAGTDTLDCLYQGLFPIIVTSDATAEIAARQASEGTTGVYEWVDENANIDSEDGALQIAGAELAKSGRLSGEVSFDTPTPGLRAGQLITINLPSFGVNGEYLIQEVSFRDIGAEWAGRFSYTVKCLDGSNVGSWQQFFKKLAAQGRAYVIRENEVLVRLRTRADGIVIGDSLSVVRAAPSTLVGTATVGYSEVG